ncbi:unnamed protein product [Camellia sinensis]
MSVIEILTRVDAICKKYDKYDFDMQKHLNLSAADANADGARLYAAVDSNIDAALQKAEAASNEKSRASAVAINAVIRRTKARLLDEVPKLEGLAIKKRFRGFRQKNLVPVMIWSLLCRIGFNPYHMGLQLHPNDLEVGQVQLPAQKSSLIVMDSSTVNTSSKQKSPANSGKNMNAENEAGDQGLEVISKGLDTLKNMAHDLNEEMDRQVPLMNEIDTKV